jgi:acyl carrier protein
MPSDHEEVRLRDFLRQRFHNYRDDFGADEDLTSVVDSLGLFELVEFVEQEYSVSIPAAEFSPRRFSSIHGILSLVDELAN